MFNNQEPPIPPGMRQNANETPTRGKALVAVLITGVALIGNHLYAMDSGKIYLWIVMIAPMILFLGLGALIDPRIMHSISGKGQHFPMKIKVIGGVLAVAGLLLSAYLALGVYRLQDGGMSHPSTSRDNMN